MKSSPRPKGPTEKGRREVLLHCIIDSSSHQRLPLTVKVQPKFDQDFQKLTFDKNNITRYEE